MDVDVFAQFYRDHYGLILSVAELRLHGRVEAEDVTAEVFRVAWMHHRDGHQLTLPWTYQVLRNLIGNEYRRTARADRLIDAVGALPPAGQADADDALEVRRCLEKLPEEDRELLYMAYWEDLSRREIGSILGCTATAVRLRLMRSRRKLEALMSSGTGVEEVSRSDGRHGTPYPSRPAC